MKIKSTDIPLDPKTLEEWHGLSPELPKKLEELLYNEIFIGYNDSTACYTPAETRGYGIPIVGDCIKVLLALERHRYIENLNLSESLSLLRSQGISLRTPQAVQNLMDKFESLIGLYKPLPKGVEEKVRDPRHRLELQRKRLIQQRVKDQLRDKRRAKAKLEKAINKQSKAQLKRAKEALMTQKEAIGETATRLKKEAKESRFEPTQISKERILFEPTAKQAEFLAAPEKVVFYGGAAGGGKSYALIFDAIRYAHRPAMRALILRRRNSELKELISVSKQNYPKAFPGAKFNESKMIWTFPSGATLEFGYFEKEDDKERYIGLPYSYIAWDEIQLQKSPEGFDFLFSRLRTTDPEITCYVRCTGNPGGAPWVKQRFIDPAPYNTPFLRHQVGEEDSGVTYKFIPATLFDNPHLTKDGEYEKILKQLPPAKVQQLLYGDWDTVDEGFFDFNKGEHIVEDIPPMHWPIISSMDYGWVDPASCLWAKIDPMTGALCVYRELEKVRATVDQWAQAISEAEAAEMYTRVDQRVIDWTLFKNTGHTGPTHLQTLDRWGINPNPADRNREAGWEQVNQRLLPDYDGQYKLYIHSSCTKLIDQLMSAQSKRTNPNDIDDTRMFSLGRKHHFDLLDCLRYMCMARPRTITRDTLLQSSKGNTAWETLNNYFS